MKKLPIGIQSFETLRKLDCIYIDKTRYIYDLTDNGRIYFISRPRRFGKSLLIDTMEELFKGSKNLFKGLYIYDKWDWGKVNPVIRIDFTGLDYNTPIELAISLNNLLFYTAKKHNIFIKEQTHEFLSSNFKALIEKLHVKYGEQAVILVDEYDKPVTDNLLNKDVLCGQQNNTS
jgi:hypothetical protein